MVILSPTTVLQHVQQINTLIPSRVLALQVVYQDLCIISDVCSIVPKDIMQTQLDSV